jgi:hypothetical protein
MTAQEFALEVVGIERCEECDHIVGNDWEYVDFTNKSIIRCPQCGEKYYENDKG